MEISVQRHIFWGQSLLRITLLKVAYFSVVSFEYSLYQRWSNLRLIFIKSGPVLLFSILTTIFIESRVNQGGAYWMWSLYRVVPLEGGPIREWSLLRWSLFKGTWMQCNVYKRQVKMNMVLIPRAAVDLLYFLCMRILGLIKQHANTFCSIFMGMILSWAHTKWGEPS